MTPVQIFQSHYTITAAEAEKLATFHSCVANAKMNLTSITDAHDFAIKHFLDSTTILPYIPPNSTVADVGSGAGFPGIVAAILRSDIKMTLIESRKKRAEFLTETVNTLALPNVTVLCDRAENIKIQYDICTARAVAPMPQLLTYIMPLLRPRGLFVAMQTSSVELDSVKKKGGIIKKTIKIELIKGMHRLLVLIEKK